MFLLVINAVLIINVKQLVFDPADFLSVFLPCLMMETVFLIKLSQAHHGLLTYTPLWEKRKHRLGEEMLFLPITNLLDAK